MKDLVSGSYKVNGSQKAADDTRNNWVSFMFVSKCRYNVFRKQSTIDACTRGFKELEAYGFEFGPIGFGGTHVHGRVNIPKKYSVEDAETNAQTAFCIADICRKIQLPKIISAAHILERI